VDTPAALATSWMVGPRCSVGLLLLAPTGEVYKGQKILRA
jgi:hypothetical protein